MTPDKTPEERAVTEAKADGFFCGASIVGLTWLFVDNWRVIFSGVTTGGGLTALGVVVGAPIVSGIAWLAKKTFSRVNLRRN